MDAAELAFSGIARQAELIRAREVSSVELVDLYLERIERIGPELNAFVAVGDERAREQAEAADRRLAAGEAAPLLGVPVALKDEVDVAGEVSGHGTRAFDRPAAADAEHWRRLREAGAVLLGRTTLPELAIVGFTETEAYGATRNPWDPGRTPGGSSGGSGAAVAAGLVGAASASDGAGSIRIPAACCGLFGLKPQRGRISLAPEREHWYGMSVTGCLTRRVLDSALWLDVAAGPAPGDPEPPPAPERPYVEAARTAPPSLRIALSRKAPRAAAPAILDPEVERGVERIAERLGEAGHTVVEHEVRWGQVGNDSAIRYLKGIQRDLAAVPHPERLEPRTRGFGRLAAPIPGALLRRTLAAEARHAARLNEIFERCDLVLMPTQGTPPVEIGRWAGQGALRTMVGMSRVYPYTAAWNYTGQPAAAIPAGWTRDGLPCSAQLVAPPNREDLLISVAAQLEEALGWPERRPPLADRAVSPPTRR